MVPFHTESGDRLACGSTSALPAVASNVWPADITSVGTTWQVAQSMAAWSPSAACARWALKLSALTSTVLSMSSGGAPSTSPSRPPWQNVQSVRQPGAPLSLWQLSQPGAPGPPVKRPLWTQLYLQVIVAIVLGAVIGHFWPSTGEALKPLGDAFIKLVKMIIAPVIFLTVVTGIAGMRDLAKVGGVAAGMN